MPGALAAARDQARATRLQARHRELAEQLQDIEAELEALGCAAPAIETDVDRILEQADQAGRRAERAEAEAAELRERLADQAPAAELRARADQAEAEAAELRVVLLAGNGPKYHAWLRRLAIEQGREFAELHRSGVSGVEIGRRHGCSSTVVYMRMKLAGYHAQPVRGSEAAERRAAARRMVADGMTRTDVAEHFGVSRRAIGKWLRHEERPLPAPKPRRPRPCKREGCPLGADQARDQAAPERAA